jgi:hypothetical protein
MSKTAEYRQLADGCIAWARLAISDDQRKQFLELAKKWMSDAESIDQGIELRRAKASEMAGDKIDRLGGQLATDEERQLRKQRLIKGPQEFRDIRSNRASCCDLSGGGGRRPRSRCARVRGSFTRRGRDKELRRGGAENCAHMGF